jgi:hypothetical protein
MRDDISNTAAPSRFGCTRRSSMKNLKILVAVLALSAVGMIGCGGGDAAAEEGTATDATATDATTGGEATDAPADPAADPAAEAPAAE